MNDPMAWLLAGFFAFASTPLQAETLPAELAALAGDASSCIAILERDSNQTLIHNPELCRKRLSPCSTFKIPNALIGLDLGILDGPDHGKEWDGTEHSRKVLNQDHDLASAIHHSVLWYFQDVAIEIGPERIQSALDSFNYGNRDISGGQGHFWLSSSLKISALEQIKFMAALDDEKLPAGKDNQAMVKQMMLQDRHLPEGFEGELYGKTGSCVSEHGEHGWFTGFLHRDGKTYVFAVNVTGNGQWGWQARDIAIKVLSNIEKKH